MERYIELLETFNSVNIFILTDNVNYLMSIGWCNATTEPRKSGVLFLCVNFEPLGIDAYISSKKFGYLFAPLLKIKARARIQIHVTVWFYTHLPRHCFENGNGSMNELPLIGAATLVLFQECTSM